MIVGNESMANFITDIPCEIAELLAVNKQLKQQLSKAQADLELAVKLSNRLLVEVIRLNDIASNGYEFLDGDVEDCINYARQTLKQIKEANEKENSN